MENLTTEPKKSKLLIVNVILGLFLIVSIFFSYGLGNNFFSKLFVFASGVIAILDALPEKSEKRPKFYGLYLFTLIWVFFAVGRSSAGIVYGQAYNFTGGIFMPVLLTLLALTVLWFFIKKK
jgi:hypothetical protein